MKPLDRGKRIAGWVPHILIGGLMIFAGSGKVFGFAPPEIVEQLKNGGLGDQIQLIGAGELITAVLLLLPWTESLGVLLTSAFWGGAICFHMSHGEPYVFQSVLLVLSWLGAWLREPATLASFTWAKPAQA
jgi:DoxX-like family